MRKFAFCLLAAIALIVLAQADVARADRHADRLAARHARTMPWHGPYYHTAWGAPVSLVVPPTAHMQVRWGWGVSQSTMTPIYHQFRRRWTGEYEITDNPFSPTPNWPSHTDQFGVYYVRGPW